MDEITIIVYLTIASMVTIIPLSIAWKDLWTKDEKSTTWRDILKVAIYILVLILAFFGFLVVVAMLTIGQDDCACT